MATESSRKPSSRKLTTPASVAYVAVGTYCATVAAFLSLYYLLNLGIPSGSPKHFGGSAFTMGWVASTMVTSSSISQDFKHHWVFPWCYLAAMVFSLVSVPLHIAAPDFIEWYIGPALTGLWGGLYWLTYTLACWQNKTSANGDTKLPNNGMNPSPQQSQTLE